MSLIFQQSKPIINQFVCLTNFDKREPIFTCKGDKKSSVIVWYSSFNWQWFKKSINMRNKEKNGINKIKAA